MSGSESYTSTYTEVDVGIVMRRVVADLVMIATSTGAVTEAKALDWAHDIELLAKGGYLDSFDLTLTSYGIETQATRFYVKTDGEQMTMSRPGGVLWPRVEQPNLRIILFYTSKYDEAARAKMASKLRIAWVPSLVDTSHSNLNSGGGRDYVSNGFGMQRKDFS